MDIPITPSRNPREDITAKPNSDLFRIPTNELFVIDTPTPPPELKADVEALPQPKRVILPKPDRPSWHAISTWRKEQAIEDLRYRIAMDDWRLEQERARQRQDEVAKAQFAEELVAHGLPEEEIEQRWNAAQEAAAKEDIEMAQIAETKTAFQQRLGELAAKPPTWPSE